MGQLVCPHRSSHMAISLTVRSGDIQRQEKVQEVELLTHQKWSGAELVDRMVNVASGGQSSTAAMGDGVTEDQFGKH